MKRHDQILTAILVVQIALGVFMFWPKSAATVGGGLLFPDLKAGVVVALTVTDDQDNSVTLRKVNGEWVVPSVDNYPARGDTIDPVVEKIAGLSTGRLIARTAASHKRLQVAADDFVRHVVVETEEGASYALYLGPGPTSSASHFRLDGQDEVYLANDLSTWDIGATITSWIDTTYFSIGEEELTRVTLENSNGAFVFTKDDAGNWTLTGLRAGEALDTGKVDTIISRVTSIILLRPLGMQEDPTYGMDDPNAVVTLEARDRIITLRVGTQHPDDNSYVIKVSESPYYARVAGYGFKDLVESTRDGFLQQPTPTPEG